MKVTASLLYFIAFIVVIAIPPAALQYARITGLLTPGFWVIFFFMSGLTFLVVTLTLMVGKRNPRYFAQAFLGGTTLKILIALIFILVFVRKTTPDKLTFLADFAYIYLLNTAFEIYVLLRSLRHKNLK